MNLAEYLEKKIEIYHNLLEFLDNKESSDEDFDDLNNIFINQKIFEKKEDLNTLFHLLLSISNDHHRSSDFFIKIERILSLFKDEFLQFFTNNEFFYIFKSNKRILLFLINEDILKINKTIAKKLSHGWYKKAKYHFYFYPEIKKYLEIKTHEKMLRITCDMKEVNSNDFEHKRLIGENDSMICKLIQKDEIDDFIIYVNKANFSLSKTIETSLYETNRYLLNKRTSLVDYSAFYGSIQIFRFLCLNKVNISPCTWIYAIHGRNPEIVHLLEEYRVVSTGGSFLDCFNESVKCHHNEIAEYVQSNLLENQVDKSVSVKCYNFEYFPRDQISKVDFYFACKYDNFFIAKNFLENFSDNFELNEVFKDGNTKHTVLTTAVKENNKEIVELLLTYPSIDVNFMSVLGRDQIAKGKRLCYKKEKNSLHIAVENGNEEIVNLLLNNENIDVNGQMDYTDATLLFRSHVEKTALNIAIEKENPKIVEILLQHPNIDVNKKSRHNDCNYGFQIGHDRYIEKVALISAVESENLKIVSLLLNHPSIDVNIVSKYHDYVYERAKGYIGNKYSQRTALQMAIENGNNKIVQLLLKNESIELNYLLFFYICCHEYESEDNYKTDYYIYKDDIDDDIDIIELNQFQNDQNKAMFSFDDVDFDGFSSKPYISKELSPLFISINERNVDITRSLLNCPNINVNYLSFIEKNKIKHSFTPLQKAIDDKCPEIIQLLKDHGAVTYI